MHLDQNAALVVIDLQKGIVSVSLAHPASDIVAQASRLAHAFREQHQPVVLVNVSGRAPGRSYHFQRIGASLFPELHRQPSDYLVTKQRVGAFIGTSLDQYLRQRGVTQVVLAGVATSVGVESTGRSAYDLGYNVAFVVDAMTDLNAEAHRHSVERVFPRFGETANTAEVLALLWQRRT